MGLVTRSSTVDGKSCWRLSSDLPIFRRTNDWFLKENGEFYDSKRDTFGICVIVFCPGASDPTVLGSRVVVVKDYIVSPKWNESIFSNTTKGFIFWGFITGLTIRRVVNTEVQKDSLFFFFFFWTFLFLSYKEKGGLTKKLTTQTHTGVNGSPTRFQIADLVTKRDREQDQ